MTRIFDALKKSEAARTLPAGHGMPAAVGRPAEVVRGSLPLLGALPIEETVLREMSALRVTLESMLRGHTPNVIMFLGPQGGEGVSTVALHFAEALSRDLKTRPLVIDCHARRPAYSVDETRRCAVPSPSFHAAAIDPQSVVSANLYVVPVSEAHHLAGLIQPAILRETIDANAPGFDWIILDGPPVLEAPDSAALAAVADGVVLVIQVGRSKRPVLTRAADLLNKAGSRVLGSVLNRRIHEIPEFLYRRI